MSYVDLAQMLGLASLRYGCSYIEPLAMAGEAPFSHVPEIERWTSVMSIADLLFDNTIEIRWDTQPDSKTPVHR
ncbi:hypothetical protein WMF30_30410 [Sorangium sp. So ce134]